MKREEFLSKRQTRIDRLQREAGKEPSKATVTWQRKRRKRKPDDAIKMYRHEED